ncbi:hypothetical protein LX97_00949 [Nonlabens dokdonensis]|jgi:hypothetical protein|uniref:Lipoprotein n=2 Tax=Nonlabens dokdonensis TaxID=328515 RepID=L7WBN4_NONDD|nr:hypothetical protein [Nonlabens dokdonensis]AGC76283.1 hypothetical protein DDD_1156 [Nonlabens dokdonensis DSW-6]PZX43944.1 hypothetical protein LX97_00949 [Nonlabens dokdonensis]
MIKPFYILFALLLIGCADKKSSPTQILENFTIDNFIDQKPISQVLIEYTTLTEDDLSTSDTDILFEYCNYVNQSHHEDLKKYDDNFEIIPYNSKSATIKVSLKENEKGYFLNVNGEPLTFYVLNTDNKIVSYYLDPFETKGNSKPAKPAYLKDILKLKKEN